MGFRTTIIIESISFIAVFLILSSAGKGDEFRCFCYNIDLLPFDFRVGRLRMEVPSDTIVVPFAMLVPTRTT